MATLAVAVWRCTLIHFPLRLAARDSKLARDAAGCEAAIYGDWEGEGQALAGVQMGIKGS
jgi:hypothetical protein